MQKEITSPTNPTIKELVRLKERKSDRSDHAFIVEGYREIDRAIKSNFELLELYYCNEVISNEGQLLLAKSKNLISLSNAAFQKIATRETSDGVIAVFSVKTNSLESLNLSQKESVLLVAVESIEKPGNLGAVLRSADASGVDAVIVLNQKVDPWNQNVIRSSLGGVFSVPVVNTTSENFLKWCQSMKIKTIGAALSDKSKIVYHTDLTQSCAVILGSEAFGLSDTVLNRANELAIIPMTGVCDSLNISVAAAIFMFEAQRQRTKI